MKYLDKNLAQNIDNAIRVLEKEMARQSPIPKELVEKTDFFHRSERINWMMLKVLVDIQRRMNRGTEAEQED